MLWTSIPAIGMSAAARLAPPMSGGGSVYLALLEGGRPQARAGEEVELAIRR